MKCSKCKYFKYTINPETGRRLTSQKGICNYLIPKLPFSLNHYFVRTFNYRDLDKININKSEVPHWREIHCDCFEN